MTDFDLGAALSQYESENEITLLDPDSLHTIEITTAKAKVTAKGPAITLFGRVYAGPQAGARVGLGTLSFSPAALWKTFPILFGLGVTKEFIQQANTGAEPAKLIADSLVGRVAEVAVIVDNWQGEDRNKIQSASVTTVGTPPAPPAPAAPAPAAQAAPAPVQAAPAPPAPVAPAAAAPEAARAPSF